MRAKLLWICGALAVVCLGTVTTSCGLNWNANNPPVITALTADPANVQPGEATVITVSAFDPEGTPLRFTWFASRGEITGSGAVVSWTSPAQIDAGEELHITCMAEDLFGGVTFEVVTVRVGDSAVLGEQNTAPEIAGIAANPPIVDPGGATTLTAAASDADGDPLTYIWTSDAGEISGSGAVAVWTAPSGTGVGGEYAITCEVTDPDEASDRRAAIVTVRPPDTPPGGSQPPEIISITAEPSVLEPSETATITVTAIDPDGAPLSYTWLTARGEITGSGAVVSWTAPDVPWAVGDSAITCVATDPSGATDRAVVIVTVIAPPNQAPVIVDLVADPLTVAPGAASRIAVTAADPDDDVLFYSWTAGAGEIQGTGSAITWTAPRVAGAYVITCRVSDPFRASVSSSVAIAVSDSAGDTTVILD